MREAIATRSPRGGIARIGSREAEVAGFQEARGYALARYDYGANVRTTDARAWEHTDNAFAVLASAEGAQPWPTRAQHAESSHRCVGVGLLLASGSRITERERFSH